MMSYKKRVRAESVPDPEVSTAIVPKTPELVLPAVSDDVIEEVYQGICNLQRGATIALAVETGKLIVDRFYGGDLTGWRTHGSDEPSLRKLAAKFKDADGDTGISAAGLFRILGIYEINERFDISTRKRLTSSHVRAVIGLPEPEQERLLTEADEKALTTRQLEEKVAKIRKKTNKDGRGRPPLPAFVKTMNMLGKLARDEDAFGELEMVRGMDAAEVQKVINQVLDMKGRLVELEDGLRKRIAS